MNRLRVKQGEPPLKYFLPVRPNRIMRMKDKVAKVASSILSFFQEHHLSQEQIDNTQHDQNSPINQSIQVKSEIPINKVNMSSLKVINKKANQLVRLSDIASQSDDEEQAVDTNLQRLNSVENRNAIADQQQSKVVSYNTNTSFLNRQLLQRKRKAAENKSNNGIKIIITPYNKDQHPDNQSQSKESQEKQDSLVLSMSASISDKSGSRPHSFRSAKQMIKKFEVEQHSLDDGDQLFYNFNSAGLPRKKVKLLNDRYLQSLEELGNKKNAIINKILPGPQSQKSNLKNKQSIQQKTKKQSDIKQESILSQSILKLQNELMSISKRKVGNSRVLKPTPYFSTVILERKPKKFDLSLDKVLEAVKQQKNTDIAQQQPIFQQTEEKRLNFGPASISDSLPFAANSSTQSPFTFLTNIGQSQINQIQPENNLIVDQNKKDSPFSNIFSNSPFSLKMDDTEKHNQILKNDENSKKDDPQEPLKLEKQKDLGLTPKQEDKQQQKKDDKKDDVLKPPTENPFLKKSSQIRPILPDFVANFNANDLFAPKQSAVASIPESGQKQQPAVSKGEFSSPTKNIYEKYPDKLNVAPAIPESQEDESSMFDESEHSASRKDQISHSPLRGMSQISNPFNSNSSSILGGQSFISQPLFSSADPKSSFLSSVPQLDIPKSMNMFGRSALNISSTDALWGTPLDDSSRKKTDISKNNKKKKQQRAYG